MASERLRKFRLKRAERRAARKSDLPPIAATADDLEAIKKSVEDAAAVSGGRWLSYLFLLFYVAIAAGAVTLVDQAFDRATAILQNCATVHKDSAQRLLDKETFGEDDLAPIRAAVKECINRPARTTAGAGASTP